ncbi:MAG: 5-methylthioadenosine/S-adenosylhomocysteine deaminase [Actinomycetota bacterium]|jgi:5-methylthioadenosine/S-adenosylhomocysteine deaminase|nr:5-methylthioadenosine/S-adenosylhomocysteine deaminase [Actinomycetota bacterium]
MPTLLRNGIVLPMTGASIAFDPGSVLVDGNEILAVGPVDAVDADPRTAGAEVVDCLGHAILPGLHNTHLHSGLLRGTAESMSLWDWLQAYVDPAHRALTPEIAAAASLHCYAESVLAGTTSVMDMWRYMEGSAAAAATVGIRATLVPYVADEAGFDYFESIESNRRLLETHRTAADGRVRTWVGLEHLFYCSDRCFADALALAEEFDTGIHTHSSESIWEVQESLKRFGRRPLEVFHQRGILTDRTVVAHCVWLDDREIQLLAQTGTAVAHCPCSNMKLASGPARIGAMHAAGVVIGLGSDGEKENNNLDLVEEMKFASLLQKVSTLDPTTGDPWEVLAMATIDGACALGLDAVTGSLEPGKRADVITVALDGLHTTPVLHGHDFNVAAHLVFSSSGHDVRDVWVDGRRLVADGVPTTFDIATVRATAQAAAEELFERRAHVLERAGLEGDDVVLEDLGAARTPAP